VSLSRAVMLAVFAGLAWWAVAPVRGPGVAHHDVPPLPEAAPIQVAVLDTAAFRAPLWVSPPAPPPAPAPPPPPPPLRLQLLAVVLEGGAYRAVLYDPDTDRVLVASEGQTVSGRTLERVSARGVRVRDQAGVRVLALRQDGTGVVP
jgi:hypothetical protein